MKKSLVASLFGFIAQRHNVARNNGLRCPGAFTMTLPSSVVRASFHGAIAGQNDVQWLIAFD